MKVLYCRKCNKETKHEYRVWNNMPNLVQVQGDVCTVCGDWQNETKKPMPKDFAEKVTRRVL